MNSQKKIIIYAEKTFLPQGKEPTILLYPFWGGPATDINDPDYGRFDEYIKCGASLFEITDDPQKSDIFLLPFEFKFEEEAIKIAKELSFKAKQLNKKVLIFFNSDSDTEIPVENAIVFRTSFYKHSQKSNEFAFIGWSADFLKFKDQAEPKKLNPAIPSISYCGYVDYVNFSEKFNINRLINNIKSKPSTAEKIGPMLRGRAVRSLLKDDRIHKNFVIRKGFWAQGMDKKMARMQYVDNMYSSDYALVVRGAGNFSYRLYEVLSCGRIPVFINTDCVLPFDQFIDWKKYVIWIEEKEMETIASRLVEFHKGMSIEDLIKRKKECREFYENWLSPKGFFSNLYKCLS